MPCPYTHVWRGLFLAALPQIISGVGVGVYWLSTFVFDVATYFIPCGAFLGLLYAFDVPSKSSISLVSIISRTAVHCCRGGVFPQAHRGNLLSIMTGI